MNFRRRFSKASIGGFLYPILERFRSMSTPSPNPDWPRTRAKAVDRIVEDLRPEQRVKLAATDEQALAQLNSGLGARVRKLCGLWQGNARLMAACGADNPEEASLTILKAVRERLRQGR